MEFLPVEKLQRASAYIRAVYCLVAQVAGQPKAEVQAENRNRCPSKPPLLFNWWKLPHRSDATDFAMPINIFANIDGLSNHTVCARQQYPATTMRRFRARTGSLTKRVTAVLLCGTWAELTDNVAMKSEKRFRDDQFIKMFSH